MSTATITERIRGLHAERRAFVTATVVRAQAPTSARAGDAAIVLPDGTIEGFVGGVCAEDSVRAHGLRAMETGEPLLLRLLPEAGEDDPEPVDGAVTSHNPCLSGGAMEIFLDPSLPAPRVVVLGDAPVAAALLDLAPRLGLDAVPGGAEPAFAEDDLALVVASHGRDEERALEAALAAGVPYVGLVASRRRGEAVRDALDVAEEERARLRTPAGLDIGARTPAEIALSILAEVVAVRRASPAVGARAPMSPRGAVVHGHSAEAGGCCHA